MQTGRVRLTGSVIAKAGDRLPAVTLPSTGGHMVDVQAESREHHLVLFFYPGDGTGLEFPELRGCTAEACSFRNHIQEFRSRGARVYGVSLQPTPRQQAFAEREHLTFELLSDEHRRLVDALGLPVWMDDHGAAYVSRVTLVVAKGGLIARVYEEVSVAGHVQEVLDAVQYMGA
jgi:thioredoxin-dependent peroxiredoxin